MMTHSPSPPHLLVVEHDAGIQDLLAAFLTSEGYAVSLATSPAEARTLLDEQTFQLVLTDLFSTNPRDRFRVVELMRASAHPPPIGVITGWNVQEEEIAQHDVAFLLRKPFDVEDLSASVEACLNPSPGPEVGAPLPPRILLVNPDTSAGGFLTRTLSLEGYEVWRAASRDEALALMDERCFHLILADLPDGSQFGGQAHLLLRHVRPTPVGAITDQSVSPEEAREQGFAFFVYKPFETAKLLAQIDAVLNRPLEREQQCLAEIVQRLFAAINAGDWETLGKLCTRDMIFIPPPRSRFSPAKKMQGLSAYCAQLEAVKSVFSDYWLENILLYPHPKGLVGRYQCRWLLPDGTIQHNTGTTLFCFQNQQIRQIAAWVNTVNLLDLLEKKRRSSA
jgi:DNA-binding response OmpR family regulator